MGYKPHQEEEPHQALARVDGHCRGLSLAKLRGRLDWVGVEVLDCINGHCDQADLYGSTVEQVFYATLTGIYEDDYPEWRVTEGVADYRAVCNIATDWKYWQYYQQCSDRQAVLHVTHRNFKPADIQE